MVYDDGNAAVWPELGKPGLLLNVLADVCKETRLVCLFRMLFVGALTDALPCILLAVRFLQFLQKNRGFPAIGRAESEQLNALVGLQSGRSLVSHVG